MTDSERVPVDQLRWRCEPDALEFEATDELEPFGEILGQERAIEAIEFGIGIEQDGYNLYALGPPAIGKHEVVERFLDKKADEEEPPPDWCYVHNFEEPNEPKALELPAGRGEPLKEDMEDLIEELKAIIPAAFESEDYQTRRQAIEEEFQQKQEEAFNQLQEEAEAEDVTVIRTPAGIALAPVRDGEVVPPDEFDELPEDEREEVEETIEELQDKFEEALKEVPRWERKRRQRIEELQEEVTRFAIQEPFDEYRDKYSDLEEVVEYLDAVQDDVVENATDILKALRLQQQPELAQQLQQAQQGGGQQGGGGQMAQAQAQAGAAAQAAFRQYQVNLLVDNADREGAPVVYEDHPTLENLVGRVEYVAQFGALMTDFNLIRDGALHRANGGYLILDARKVLMNRLSWEQLKRSLFADEVRIESTRQIMGMARTVSLEPESIPLDLKIVLVGSRRLYYLLCQVDPEFAELFKVSADFEEDMDRDDDVVEAYPQTLKGYIDENGLEPFEDDAIARVIERSVRVAGDQEKLSLESEAIQDLLREANYWAKDADREVVTDADVQQAIDAQIRRKSRIRDRLQEQIERETILIDTDGEEIGQINGLSVLHLDGYAFGKPNRITARARMGEGEVVDIEREVELGGPIHSKGVMILSGFLGARYAQNNPMSLSASLVFEQAYGGIEGDSASLAETIALVSALADVPVRQDYSVTGSMNQHGRVQAIGGINHKIEGFFETCKRRGLTGDQGVVMPSSNLEHLMVRHEIVEAVEKDQFQVYAVDHVDEALEILTGQQAGKRDEDGNFPEGTINYRVQKRLEDLAERARKFAGD
ncbi:MAG: Lon protease family protein [Bradymonadaceae bacterium]